MATKKKTPVVTTETEFGKIENPQLTEDVEFPDKSCEPSIEDQIDMLEYERRQYEKKIEALDKKIRKLKSKKVYAEAAEEIKEWRDAALASGMSEAVVDDVIKDVFKKTMKV